MGYKISTITALKKKKPTDIGKWQLQLCQYNKLQFSYMNTKLVGVLSPVII